MQETIRIIHADEYRMVRNAFKALVKGEAPHIQVVAEAVSYKELIKALNQHPFDILLLDSLMLGGNEREILSVFKKQYPELKILLFWVDSEEINQSSYGHLINGRVEHGISNKEIINTIEIIMRGERYFSLQVYKK